MKNYLIYIFLFCFLSPDLFAQEDPEKNKRVEMTVTNETGSPVEGALVYGNEGAVVVKTDAQGRVTLSVFSGTDILIEADGYESVLLLSSEYGNSVNLKLKKTLLLYGTKDDVYIAFDKIKQGYLANAVSVFNPEVMKYDNTLSLTDLLEGGAVPGLLGWHNVRGIGQPLYIVDGLPRDISMFNLNEIEQISVLKDINASVLYGTGAVNGVVQITTKRGQPYKQRLNVSGYYGIAKPTALPKYLSSADYMELYNEARVNDGLSKQFDQTQISNFRNGNKYRYPDVDYYSKDYLRPISPLFNLLTDISGGNSAAAYYTSVNWTQEGSLIDFGNGKDAKHNRFNIMGNVDLKINDWINTALDAVAIFNNEKTLAGDYWANAAVLKPNLFTPLLPIDLMDPADPTMLARKNDIDGKYMLGGTSAYQTNPIAGAYSGGDLEVVQRFYSFNNRINFDFDKWVKGLSFHVNFGFDFSTQYNQSISNSYAVYEPKWDDNSDQIVSLVKYGEDLRSGTQTVGAGLFQRRFGSNMHLNYDRLFDDVHHVSATLLAFGYRFKVTGQTQADKYANLGLRLAYTYNKKYMVDFSNAYVNSAKLPDHNRSAFSPSLGLAWMISSEDFMSDTEFVDYLKIRLSAGIANSDNSVPGYFYYNDVYLSSGTFRWNDNGTSSSNTGVITNYGRNQNLFFEKRKEINFGFDGLFFDKMVGVYTNVFASVYSDRIAKLNTLYPDFYNDFVPYANYNEDAYRGIELGLTFNRKFDDFRVSAGVNMLYSNSEVKKRDELYMDDYQYRKGNPTDARFGLVSNGFFSDAADIAASPFQLFGDVKPGDIKYVDQNNDGIIDQNDEVYIGRTQAPFSYGVNIQLSYDKFTLFASGHGRYGADNMISGDYFWVDGDDKYSEYVLNRWTEATKNTATYPRLSSLSNNNNFRNSTFWQYRDNYFTLDRVQLTYDFPEKIYRALRMKWLCVYLRTDNPFTISKHNDVKQLNIGGSPFMRSYSIGAKMTF
jgi:TonB-linked SusC/RagA family outer membrane protein